MDFSNNSNGLEDPIIDLFTVTFTDSEGADEGALIGNLVRQLLSKTPKQDIKVFAAFEGGKTIGAAVFTRLTYESDPRSVFILSPMAVATDLHGKGVGKQLLTHALDVLRTDGVAVAITYGDPAFYGKVGFSALDQTKVAPPLPLSHPTGWIGQSLTDETLHALQGKCTCVAALNDPAFW